MPRRRLGSAGRVEQWKHLRITDVVESPFAADRLRTGAAKRFKKVPNATKMPAGHGKRQRGALRPTTRRHGVSLSHGCRDRCLPARRKPVACRFVCWPGRLGGTPTRRQRPSRAAAVTATHRESNRRPKKPSIGSSPAPTRRGYAQPDDVNKAIKAGFDGHVAKPPGAEKLDRLLR